MNRKVIAFDVMSSEQKFPLAVAAAVQFAQVNPDFTLILTGQKKALSPLISSDLSNIKIVDCPEIITMEDNVLAFRSKKQSSLVASVDLVKQGKATAILSAANTGAYLTYAFLAIKPLFKNLKPALAGFITLDSGKAKLLLDLGAGINNSPAQLNDFATMGSLYYQVLYPTTTRPRIGLGANGTEDHKGNKESKAAFQLLKANPKINFCGNIEPKTLFVDDVDVIVYDGFVGNLVLKTISGTAKGVGAMIKTSFSKTWIRKLASLFLLKAFKEVKANASSDKTGGAILLGLKQIVIKAHGDSGTRAFVNALELAKKLINGQIITKMEKDLNYESLRSV